MKILVINGVNLNMLGKRNHDHYGSYTLDQLNDMVNNYAIQRNATTEFYFSNHEGDIVDKIQTTDADAIVINAGAYSHYSIAIRDAIECCGIPTCEVHLSNIMEREIFRHTRILDGVVVGCYYGEKEVSYYKAIDLLTNL